MLVGPRISGDPGTAPKLGIMSESSESDTPVNLLEWELWACGLQTGKGFRRFALQLSCPLDFSFDVHEAILNRSEA